MMKRRTFITASIGAMVGLAGCSGIQEQFEFEAEPASFADTAVEAAGYEALDQREIVDEREVETGDTTRTLTVTNYAQGYKRDVTVEIENQEVTIDGDERSLAAAAVVSTPSMSVVGEEFNPVAKESPSELVERARERMDEQIEGSQIRNISKVDELNRTILGTETTVAVYEAVTDIEGEPITLRVYLSKVKHDGDFVLVAGGFPKQLADDEWPALQQLFDNVEHDGDD